MQKGISFEATAMAQYIYQNKTSAIKERPQETSCFSISLDTRQNKNCSKALSRHGTELWMLDFLIILFFGPSVMLTTDSKKWQIFRPICVLMKFDLYAHICASVLKLKEKIRKNKDVQIFNHKVLAILKVKNWPLFFSKSCPEASPVLTSGLLFKG